ncbi:MULTISPECIES: JAB domain-containing protein [Acidithiobacillus]|uniref:MPN domain-containing protein n=3 Tax=Acidithiobacillus TaxID=119977 RepID=A0A179BPC7_ACIFR|nr:MULTISPECIES: DNA repair protein RadC [Acidithiobacillus]MEB8485983.1 DNA repair protein RadC [Acidithiobacillus ferriphilus]MEB8489612.1 DNA repair protein RadC [Acidithiobacillus ferriphilus]MEB8492497.1 DNA repair protein RadC [Acidithiobacillus ferriphilus]MEB8515436.1 DNA repair protein RadC [Acidithiobacillus ferriphilus]MEB8521420.1 DNA repair protein RadC [Acidithiobacillus ferriphilus]
MNPYHNTPDAELLRIVAGDDVAKALQHRPLIEICGFRQPTMRTGVEESPSVYGIPPAIDAARELFTRCLATAMNMEGSHRISSAQNAKDFVRMKCAGLEREVFSVIWMNKKHDVIAVENLFLGTVDSSQVHPREVVKSAIKQNAVSAAFYHNHPSGHAEPSPADIKITKTLADALNVIDVWVLDHLIVAGTDVASLRERGEM